MLEKTLAITFHTPRSNNQAALDHRIPCYIVLKSIAHSICIWNFGLAIMPSLMTDYNGIICPYSFENYSGHIVKLMKASYVQILNTSLN